MPSCGCNWELPEPDLHSGLWFGPRIWSAAAVKSCRVVAFSLLSHRIWERDLRRYLENAERPVGGTPALREGRCNWGRWRRPSSIELVCPEAFFCRNWTMAGFRKFV